MFNKKCAYCESKYGVSSRVEVEHFRPKAGIENELTNIFSRPGYYWLAWEWKNLLPSCMNCNQRSSRKMWGGLSKVKSGKGNLFPLENPKKRARAPGKEKGEKPLLINPCTEDPDKFLSFTDDGLVFAKVLARGNRSKKGEVSIEIYGLLRENLVEERKQIATLILSKIENIKRLDMRCKKFPSSEVAALDLTNAIDELKTLVHPEKAYFAMAKQMIKRHFE